MSAPLLALCAALSWSISHVLVRLASRSIAPLVGVVLSLTASSTVLVIALAIRGDIQADPAAIAFFAAAGVFGPGLGRILSITAISKIGATRSSPVQSAAQPIVTVGFGILVFSETVGVTRFLGIALTLSGVLLVIWSNQRGQAAPTLRAGSTDSTVATVTGSNLRLMLWPVAAGTAFASADVVRKGGMQVLDDALLGGAIGVLVALAIWGTVLVSRGQGPEFVNHVRSPDARWFLMSGAASGAATVFVLSAFRDGDLSLVGPIVAVQPILVALIARIFINRLERVGLAIAVAALLATAGTVLISI